MATREYAGIVEAARLTGVARDKLITLIELGMIKVYRSPIDKRFKLVKLSEIEEAREAVFPEADLQPNGVAPAGVSQ
jgi:hypothetical protein